MPKKIYSLLIMLNKLSPIYTTQESTKLMTTKILLIERMEKTISKKILLVKVVSHSYANIARTCKMMLNWIMHSIRMVS